MKGEFDVILKILEIIKRPLFELLKKWEKLQKLVQNSL